jgi:hypothetical protein
MARLKKEQVELYEPIFKSLNETQVVRSEQLANEGKIMHCPFCSHRRGNFLAKLLNDMLREYADPNDIYKTMTQQGVVIKHPITKKPLGMYEFHKVIGSHITLCRKEDYNDYQAKYKFKRKELELREELQNELKLRGIDSHINMGNHLVTPRSAKELKDNMGEFLPSIMHNQLLIIQREQERYLNGEIYNPPDIKALSQILLNLKTLIGSHELTDIIEK